MKSAATGWTDVLKRLESLERQNRRLKQIGAAAFVALAALVLVGQVSPTRTVAAQASPQRTVEANEFVLKDSNGNVRGRLFMGLLGPQLGLLDASGQQRVVLSNNALGVIALSLTDANGKLRFALGEEILSYHDANGVMRTTLSSERLTLSDEQGFQTTIGTTNLVTPRTGETHKTSAASVVLFDNDKNVLWKAP